MSSLVPGFFPSAQCFRRFIHDACTFSSFHFIAKYECLCGWLLYNKSKLCGKNGMSSQKLEKKATFEYFLCHIDQFLLQHLLLQKVFLHKQNCSIIITNSSHIFHKYFSKKIEVLEFLIDTQLILISLNKYIHRSPLCGNHCCMNVLMF